MLSECETLMLLVPVDIWRTEIGPKLTSIERFSMFSYEKQMSGRINVFYNMRQTCKTFANIVQKAFSVPSHQVGSDVAFGLTIRFMDIPLYLKQWSEYDQLGDSNNNLSWKSRPSWTAVTVSLKNISDMSNRGTGAFTLIEEGLKSIQPTVVTIDWRDIDRKQRYNNTNGKPEDEPKQRMLSPFSVSSPLLSGSEAKNNVKTNIFAIPHSVKLLIIRDPKAARSKQHIEVVAQKPFFCNALKWMKAMYERGALSPNTVVVYWSDSIFNNGPYLCKIHSQGSSKLRGVIACSIAKLYYRPEDTTFDYFTTDKLIDMRARTASEIDMLQINPNQILHDFMNGVSRKRPSLLFSNKTSDPDLKRRIKIILEVLGADLRVSGKEIWRMSSIFDLFSGEERFASVFKDIEREKGMKDHPPDESSVYKEDDTTRPLKKRKVQIF